MRFLFFGLVLLLAGMVAAQALLPSAVDGLVAEAVAKCLGGVVAITARTAAFPAVKVLAGRLDGQQIPLEVPGRFRLDGGVVEFVPTGISIGGWDLGRTFTERLLAQVRYRLPLPSLPGGLVMQEIRVEGEGVWLRAFRREDGFPPLLTAAVGG